MSTSPRDQNALTAGHVSPTSTRAPRRGEELWRLVNGDHVLVCELLDDVDAGAGFGREGQPPEPVTASNPLVGLEVLVLTAWLENSPRLRTAVSTSPRNQHALESAVRAAVEEQRVAELQLRAAGLPQHEAEALTAPAMWTPPTWPRRQR